MDLEAEAEAQAALLADELLARLVCDHSAWRPWRRRGVAVGLYIARLVGFRR
jgi:hypothetical protein